MPKFFGGIGFGKYIFSESQINLVMNSLTGSGDRNFPVWSEKNIALAQQEKSSLGTELHSNRVSHLPTFNSLLIVADVCLTNRTELFQKFGVLPSAQENFSDDHLILRSYEKWGEDCVKYLTGDFAFAIWDKKNKKLFCARDHLGGSPFFYYQDNEKFVFASGPRGILSLGNIEKRFNKNKLIQYLLPVSPTLSMRESWFKNIFSLPAGTVLTVKENKVKTRTYWCPEPVAPLSYKDDRETLEAFQELFFEIMEAHLKGIDPVTALLSGGLDSSAIVSVASRILEKQNKEITVFSSVLPKNNKDSQFEDERFYIDQFQTFENVNIKYISVPEKGPFSDLSELSQNYDAPTINSRHFLNGAFVKEAHRLRSKVLFTGLFGELGPTFHGDGGYAEMFSRFKWRTLARELRLRKKLYGDSIKYNLRANVLNPFLPDFLIKLIRGNSPREVYLNKNSPLRKEFTDQLFGKINLAGHLPARMSAEHKKNQLNSITLARRRRSEFMTPSFYREQVELRNPFLEKRLLEFCLAAPLHLKIRDGYNRYLIRAGLDQILPSKIQWRTTKTPFSPDYRRRFNAQIGDVRKFLTEIKPNDPVREILDIDNIIKKANLPWHDSKSYTLNQSIATNYLPQAMYLIYFLRRFSEFRP